MRWNSLVLIYVIGSIINGQSRETGNIGYSRRGKTKQKHNTICDGDHYALTNTNNANKTWPPPTNNRR